MFKKQQLLFYQEGELSLIINTKKLEQLQN